MSNKIISNNVLEKPIEQKSLEEKFGIILMIDALGVSKYNINECKDYLKKQNDLKQFIEDLIRLKELAREQETIASPLNISMESVIFGDTIIICYPLKNDEILSKYCQDLFSVSLEASVIVSWGIQKGILFRGCITIGKYLHDGNSIIGPAIFDAVDWYEIADWCGIIVSPKSQMWIEAVIDQKKKDDGQDLSQYEKLTKHEAFRNYEVPLSKIQKAPNSKQLLTVPWPDLFFDKESPFYPNDLTIRGNFLKMLYNIPQSKGTESKFENTLAYFDNCMAKIDPNENNQ